MITKYYNVEEAARILRVEKITIRKWCKSGLLKSKRVGKKWLIPEVELNLSESDDIRTREEL